MNTFRALKDLHEFRKRHLPFLRTVEDIELMREIGLSQAAGRPMQLKALFLLGIGSVATIQRRLTRLRRLGVIREMRAAHDRRVVALSIDPKILKLYEHMGKLMRKAWT
jgi:hypothetical protein